MTTGGSPVTGAPIFLTNTDSGQMLTVRSDQLGNYSIGGLGPGTYSIYSSFDSDGPRMKNSDLVSVSEGGTATHALELILP